MKRLLLLLCCATLFSVIGPVPSASASWWPWHHHSKNSGSGSPHAPKPSKSKSPKAPKAKKEKHHHQKAAKTDNAGVGTTPGPRSVGWWHKQPGPAGAGAN